MLGKNKENENKEEKEKKNNDNQENNTEAFFLSKEELTITLKSMGFGDRVCELQLQHIILLEFVLPNTKEILQKIRNHKIGDVIQYIAMCKV